MAGYRPHLTASPPCYHRIPPTDTHLTGSRGSCLPSTLPRQLAGTGRSEWPVFPGSGRAHWEAGARRLRLRQIELATVSRTLLASLTFRSRWPSWDRLEFFFFQIDWKRVNSGPDSLFSSLQCSRWSERSDQIWAILNVRLGDEPTSSRYRSNHNLFLSVTLSYFTVITTAAMWKLKYSSTDSQMAFVSCLKLH